MNQETLPRVAQELGISRQTLHNYLRKHPELRKFVEVRLKGKKKFYLVVDKTSFFNELKKLGVFIPEVGNED